MASIRIELVGRARRGVLTPTRIPMGTELDRGEVMIGRSPRRHRSVILQDPTVSPRHARIWYGDNGWWVEDLGSDNGTWVFELDAEGSVRLHGGKRVQELAITEPVVLAMGAVLVRVTPVPTREPSRAHVR